MRMPPFFCRYSRVLRLSVRSSLGVCALSMPHYANVGEEEHAFAVYEGPCWTCSPLIFMS